MDILLLITSSCFFIWLCRNILFWLYQLQKNDYKISKIFVKRKRFFTNKYFLAVLFLQILAIVTYILSIFWESFIQYFHSYILFMYVFQILLLLREIALGRIKLPTFTKRIFFLLIVTVGCISLLYLVPVLDIYIWIVILDRLTFVLICIFTFSTSFPAEVHTDMLLESVKNKRKKISNLKIICLLGTSHKSLTAYFLYELLREKYPVYVKESSFFRVEDLEKLFHKKYTEETILIIPVESINTSEVVSFLQTLMPDVSLTIANVNDEELFERIKNDSEYLLRPEKAMNIFVLKGKNVKKQSSILSRSLHSKERNTLRFITYEDNTTEIVVNNRSFISEISYKPDRTEFSLVSDGEKVELTVPIFSELTFLPFISALYISQNLGLSLKDILNSVENLQLPSGYMNIVSFTKGTIFNATRFSEQELYSLINYLATFKGKKILLISPEENSLALKYFFINIKKTTIKDLLIITHADTYHFFIKYINPSISIRLIKYDNPEEAVRIISYYLKKKDDLALFIGNGTKDILEEYKKLYS